MPPIPAALMSSAVSTPSTFFAARVASVDWLVLNLGSELFFLDLALDDAEGRRVASNRYLFSLTGGLAGIVLGVAIGVAGRLVRR